MRSRDIYMMVTVGLFFRICVSIWNGFWGPSLGANADATSFHKAASNLYLYPGPMSELSEIAARGQHHLYYHPDYAHGFHLLDSLYAKLLARAYFISTDSLFIGGLFSALAWSVSALILVQIMQLLEVKKRDQFIAMVIYSLLPSSILFTGVTLREPFQLLIVNTTLFAVLKVYLNNSIKFGIFLIPLIYIMEKFHFSLFFLGLFMVFALLVLLLLKNWDNVFLSKGIFMAPVIVLIVYFTLFRKGLTNFIPYYGTDKVLSTAAITSFLTNSISANIAGEVRTQFLHKIEIQGIIDFLFFLPNNFFHYLFEPMPWHVSSIMDICILLENILRAALIFKGISTIYHTLTPHRRLVIFTFFSYLIFEAVWSIGTVNWGTAIRHHVPAAGLLLAGAFAYSKKVQNQNLMQIQ